MIHLYVYLPVLPIKQIVNVFCFLSNVFLCMIRRTNERSTLYNAESFLQTDGFVCGELLWRHILGNRIMTVRRLQILSVL